MNSSTYQDSWATAWVKALKEARGAERDLLEGLEFLYLFRPAERGNVEASRTLAGIAARYLREGKGVPRLLRDWICNRADSPTLAGQASALLRELEALSPSLRAKLCELLELIAQGKAPPFGPTTRSSRGLKGMADHLDLSIAARVAELRREGMTMERAAAQVAEEAAVSESTVRRLWARERHNYPKSDGGSAKGGNRLPIFEPPYAKLIEVAQSGDQDVSDWLASHAARRLRAGAELPRMLVDWLETRTEKKSSQQIACQLLP